MLTSDSNPAPTRPAEVTGTLTGNERRLIDAILRPLNVAAARRAREARRGAR